MKWLAVAIGAALAPFVSRCHEEDATLVLLQTFVLGDDDSTGRTNGVFDVPGFNGELVKGILRKFAMGPIDVTRVPDLLPLVPLVVNVVTSTALDLSVHTRDVVKEAASWQDRQVEQLGNATSPARVVATWKAIIDHVRAQWNMLSETVSTMLVDDNWKAINYVIQALLQQDLGRAALKSAVVAFLKGYGPAKELLAAAPPSGEDAAAALRAGREQLLSASREIRKRTSAVQRVRIMNELNGLSLLKDSALTIVRTVFPKNNASDHDEIVREVGRAIDEGVTAEQMRSCGEALGAVATNLEAFTDMLEQALLGSLSRLDLTDPLSLPEEKALGQQLELGKKSLELEMELEKTKKEALSMQAQVQHFRHRAEEGDQEAARWKREAQELRKAAEEEAARRTKEQAAVAAAATTTPPKAAEDSEDTAPRPAAVRAAPTRVLAESVGTLKPDHEDATQRTSANLPAWAQAESISVLKQEQSAFDAAMAARRRLQSGTSARAQAPEAVEAGSGDSGSESPAGTSQDASGSSKGPLVGTPIRSGARGVTPAALGILAGTLALCWRA